MTNAALLFLCATLTAPVPKEKPELLPVGAVMRLGELRFRGPSTDGVVFSRDGKTLLALDRSTLFRWDAVTGRRFDSVELGVKGACGGFVSEDRVFVFYPTRLPGAKWNTFSVTVFDDDGKKLLDFDTDFGTRGAELSHSLDVERVGVNYRAAGGRWLYGHTFRSDNGRVYDAVKGTMVWKKEKDELRVDNPLVSIDAKVVFGFDDSSVTRRPLLTEGKSDILSCTTQVRGHAFTADGKRLVALCVADSDDREKRNASSRVAVWLTDAEMTSDNPGGLLGPAREFAVPGPVWGFLPLGPDAVLIGRGASGRIDCYDLTNGKRKWTADPPVRCERPELHPQLAATADGKRIAVSNGQCVTAVLDGVTGARLDEVTSLDGEVRGVWYSADGKTIFTASDGGARAWDAATGKPLAATHPKGEDWHSFSGVHGGMPVWMQFYYSSEPGDNFRFTAWDVVADKPAWRFDTTFRSSSCIHAVFGDCFVLDQGLFRGEFAVFGERRKEVARWKVAEEVRVRTLDEGTVRLGDDLLIRGVAEEKGANPKAVRLALTDGKVVGKVPVLRGKRGWYDEPKAASIDGKLVAFFGYDGLAVLEPGGGKLVAEIPPGVTMPDESLYAEGNNGPCGPVAFSPDGKWLLAGDHDSPTVRLVNLADASKPKPLTGTTAATAVVFSPDGKKAVVGYRDGTALVWDVSK